MQRDEVTPLHSSLGNRVRFHLKKIIIIRYTLQSFLFSDLSQVSSFSLASPCQPMNNEECRCVLGGEISLLTRKHKVLISVGAWIFGALAFWKKPRTDTAAKGTLIGCRSCTMLTQDDSSQTRWVWPLFLCSCLQKAKNVWCQAGGLANRPECYCPHLLLNFSSAWGRWPSQA